MWILLHHAPVAEPSCHQRGTAATNDDATEPVAQIRLRCIGSA
jgi:hypothetical protein